jgi:hypothetical protein
MYEISLYKKLITLVLINKEAFSKSNAFTNIPEICDSSTLWNEMEKIKPDLFNSEFDPDDFDIALDELIKNKVIKCKVTIEETAFGKDEVDNLWIAKDMINPLKRIYNYDEYKKNQIESIESRFQKEN